MRTLGWSGVTLERRKGSKFSADLHLLRRVGNSGGERLNSLPKAEARCAFKAHGEQSPLGPVEDV